MTAVVTVDIKNPLKVQNRVIYDGIEGRQRPISIPHGQTKTSVEISKVVYDELVETAQKRPGQELIVTISAQKTAPIAEPEQGGKTKTK